MVDIAVRRITLCCHTYCKWRRVFRNMSYIHRRTEAERRLTKCRATARYINETLTHHCDDVGISCHGAVIAVLLPGLYWLLTYWTPRETQHFCITFVQRRPNVFDVVPALYKCYTNVLCLLGHRVLIRFASFCAGNMATPWPDHWLRGRFSVVSHTIGMTRLEDRIIKWMSSGEPQGAILGNEREQGTLEI